MGGLSHGRWMWGRDLKPRLHNICIMAQPRASATAAAAAAVFATVYVTCGRRGDARVLSALAAVASSLPHSSSPACPVYAFSDPAYNRSSFTFAGDDPAEVARAAARLASAAFREPSLRIAPGMATSSSPRPHPRLGVVDHILVSPLRDGAPLTSAADCAAAIGAAIAQHAPVFFYGACSSPPRTLADIRRASPYFSRTAEGGGGGLAVALPPDLGPAHPEDGIGVCLLGAVGAVLNYNVRLHVMVRRRNGDEGSVSDADTTRAAAAARAVARTVSTRGGGLPAVEALALEYPSSAAAAEDGGDDFADGGGEFGPLSIRRPPPVVLPPLDDDEVCAGTWEIACNLLDVSVSPPDAVMRRIEEVVGAAKESSGARGKGGPDAQPLRLVVGTGYSIGLSRREAEAAWEEGKR
jgi:hypothetical protein